MKTLILRLALSALATADPIASAATILQSPGSGTVAFEAEENVIIVPGSPTSFVITNDATPSGNTALFAAGVNNTAFPTSFASYAIKFSAPGIYKVFFRWRANELYTDADPNSANSFYAPNRFNSSTSPLNPNPDYGVSTVNNTRVRPESNTYHVDPENNNLLTVSQEQVDAGQPLYFTLGTREAGMTFDRIVLTLDQSLTESGFNALENTGAAIPPQISAVVGSASLTTVKVTFTKAIDQFSLDPGNFVLNGGVTVESASLDPVTLKDVILTTTPQTEGFRYTMVVNNVNDLGNNFIAPNTTVQFYAWQLARGFTRREYYFTLTGSDVASLTSAPKFPDSPDRVDVTQGLFSLNDPHVQNYGVRLRGFFIPDQSAIYEFFMYNDNDAQLSLSADSTPAGLQPILNATTSASMSFDSAVVGVSPGSLVAGQRYFIEVLLKQGADYDSFVNVAARPQDDPTPASQLPPLAGNRIGALVDPATATLQITRQPARRGCHPGAERAAIGPRAAGAHHLDPGRKCRGFMGRCGHRFHFGVESLTGPCSRSELGSGGRRTEPISGGRKRLRPLGMRARSQQFLPPPQTVSEFVPARVQRGQPRPRGHGCPRSRSD